MPKREPTPPPEDESKFLSIFYPWPPYVTLGYEDESKKCARWLACFIGQDNVYALFHKPSSPNTIIIEISNEITDEKMRNILGAHDWGKVFPNYKSDQGTTHSRIFYSTFLSRREVEKTGWKTRLVTDDWFKGFNPDSGKMITYPYPKSAFCEPPDLAETVNALQLFRPLPGDIFPEARKRPAPTGSASAPPAAPPPRVVPGSGVKPAADPNARPTAPVTRSAEAGAKAKITHSQPQIRRNVYDEDSEGDDGYGNYAMHHQDEEEEGEEEEEKKLKSRKPDQKVKDLAKGLENVQVNEDYGEYATPQFDDPFIRAKQQEVPVSKEDICPFHRKTNCKPSMCQWASDRRRNEKQRQSRTGGRSGQNTRRW